MRNLHSLLFIGFIGFACLGTACRKSLGEEDSAAKQRSNDFQASVKDHKYKLVAFYADKPVDYISNDSEIRSETDLWAYVKSYVVDDENYFGANGKLTIFQKANKAPTNSAEQIDASYAITARGTDVSVTFIDYFYNALEYKLHEFDNAYFTVYVDGPTGSKLYSKYARVE
jgi:hypothetical protein